MPNDAFDLLKIIVLDDVEDVGLAVSEFLTDAGHKATSVSSARALLESLAAERFDVALLDIQLEHECSIGEFRDLCGKLFPTADIPYSPILQELSQDFSDPVSGNFLLPVVKAIAPRIEVMMLTGWAGEEDSQYFRKWGSYDTILKYSPDNLLRRTAKVTGLDRELLKSLREISSARRRQG